MHCDMGRHSSSLLSRSIAQAFDAYFLMNEGKCLVARRSTCVRRHRTRRLRSCDGQPSSWHCGIAKGGFLRPLDRRVGNAHARSCAP